MKGARQPAEDIDLPLDLTAVVALIEPSLPPGDFRQDILGLGLPPAGCCRSRLILLSEHIREFRSGNLQRITGREVDRIADGGGEKIAIGRESGQQSEPVLQVDCADRREIPALQASSDEVARGFLRLRAPDRR